uniref:Uncharacterized protein n=1 Tax=Parascaris univalens TaxID=6257 RepID=A0A915AFT0_PARUN
MTLLFGLFSLSSFRVFDDSFKALNKLAKQRSALIKCRFLSHQFLRTQFLLYFQYNSTRDMVR